MIEILKWWGDNPILGCILLLAIVMALDVIFTPMGNWFRREKK